MVKLLIKVFFVLLPIWLEAKTNDFVNIRVSCTPTSACSNIISRVSKERISTTQIEKIRSFMTLILENPQVNYLSYQLLLQDGKHYLDIKLRLKRRISEIIISIPGHDYNNYLLPLMDVKEGEYLEERSLIESIRKVEDYFATIGYPNADLSYELVEDGENYIIFIKGNIANKLIINRFEILHSNINMQRRFESFFAKYRGRIYNKLLISVDLENLRSELQNEGFLQVRAKELPPLKIKESEVIVVLEVILGERYQFYVQENRFIDKLQFRKLLFERLKANEFLLNDDLIRSIIHEELAKHGHYQASINIKVTEATSKQGVKILNYFIDFKEGARKMIRGLDFEGTSGEHLDRLRDLYTSGRSSLARNNIYDRVFLEHFPRQIERYYISNGFSFALVQGPFVTNLNDHLVDVNFKVKEGPQIVVNSFVVNGLKNFSIDLDQLEIRNRPGQNYNPYEISDDLQKILSMLKEAGYLNGKYASIEAKDILSFSKDYSSVNIKVRVDSGNLHRLNTVEIFGPDNVSALVIDREIDLRPGDVLTPKEIERIRSSLSQLGLFSRVEVEMRTVLVSGNDEFVNLFIRLKEKKFGTVEFAPGYRTDLGYKISGTVIYNNLFERNVIGSFKLQTNMRDTNDGLDPRRMAENHRKLEGMIETSLVEPYLFNYPVVAEVAIGNEAKRFYDFDANITRVTAGVSKNIWEKVQLGLVYKFEFINQEDASDDKDRGFFQIGSFTPSISYDRRDSKHRTTKGYYLGISYQLARPEFGSRQDQELAIDYSKIVANAKGYYPLSSALVLAVSLGVGIEVNHRQEIVWNEAGTAPLLNSDGKPRTLGHIPSIDVFRLDGFYNVRGFSDEEINRLASGRDINDEVIQDRAYLLNIKLEPRYFYSDSIAIGPFWDAGRLFTKGLFSSSLRSSVGISFKYMTPIGSLDFDYGVKLFPGKGPDGMPEQLGRFHLSVGTF